MYFICLYTVSVFTMSKETGDADFNEVIDNILLAENVAEEEAYKEGYAAGKNELVEGFHYGYHRASSLAAQLGYYFGVLMYIQKSFDIPKILDLSNKLMKEIQEFPVDNDSLVDIFEKFEKIKLNFKKICSLAKIDAAYPEANKLDF